MDYPIDLPRPFLALAPMDDVTDTVFRQIVATNAPADLYYTEFTNVDGLQSVGRSKLLRKMRFDQSEKSLIAHIWGLQPINFETTARQIVDGTFAKELGHPKGCNYVGIDLNMGCPAKSEVRAGACSALINNRPLASQIIEATKRGAEGKLPVSVKTRLGFSEIDLSWIEFLLSHKLSMLTVHLRTRKEMSKVPAHYLYIDELVKLRNKLSPDTLLVANGDIEDRSAALRLINNHGLDGAMIGRGIFNDPFAFADNSPWPETGPADRLRLYARQIDLFRQTWKAGERNIKTLNKFCKVYVNGFDGAKELRERLMAANSIDQLVDILSSAFTISVDD